jgi:hypothetical protein
MLNKHEGKYSTTHKELLAVLFGTKPHICFLYGRKFQTVTDHAALKWLNTVQNHQCARLTRWVLKLSEYEFDIIHKPGKQHINADVLSGHTAPVNGKKEIQPEVKNYRYALLCGNRARISTSSGSTTSGNPRTSCLDRLLSGSGFYFQLSKRLGFRWAHIQHSIETVSFCGCSD